MSKQPRKCPKCHETLAHCRCFDRKVWSAGATPDQGATPLVGTGEMVGLASREAVGALASLRNAAQIREIRLRRQLSGVIRKIREERVKIAAWQEAIAAAEAVAQRGEPNS